MRNWTFLLIFAALALLLTLPLALHTPTYVADFGDPLLNTWAIAWGQRALLQPWASVRELFNANGFYPYPLSLAFSEHLLPYAALTLPLLALQLGPIFAHNAAILFSLAIAGLGMALLVTHWTGNRWAGLLAGVIFAFVPARLNHWAHLHQLSIQWLPFIILSLDCWLKAGLTLDTDADERDEGTPPGPRRKLTVNHWREVLLFTIFLNLQLLSAVNYIPQTLLLVALFLLFALLRYRRQLFNRRIIAGGLAALAVTAALNWPIVSIYFQASRLHNFQRNLGDAAIYGAALLDYLTPPPENTLYGNWLTPLLADAARPLIPLFVGLLPLLLALAGLSLLWSHVRVASGQKWLVAFLLALSLLALLLSFGANSAALGSSLAGITPYLLPYPWLFENVPGVSGLRVPARMAILVFFGLAALAGLGAARLGLKKGRWPRILLPAATLLVLLEYAALPLPGVHAPAGDDLPPVYRHIPARAVLLELPYNLAQGGPNELSRLYFSAAGWYRLVNGASGFNPAGLADLSAQMQRFPDAASFELLQHLGVTHLLLHRAEYPADRWNDLWAKLPTYLPAVAQVQQFGDDFLLTLTPAACPSLPRNLSAHARQIDGQLAVQLTNSGPASLVANPPIANTAQAAAATRQFIEPLFVPPGESRTVPRLLPLPPTFAGEIALDLPQFSLNGAYPLDPPPPAHAAAAEPPPLAANFRFGENLTLAGLYLYARDGANCRLTGLDLYWEAAAPPAAVAQVQVVDKFGQPVAASRSRLQAAGSMVDAHALPLIETLPPGQYGLLLSVSDAGGAPLPPGNTGERLVVGPAVLVGDVWVRPAPPQGINLPPQPLATFDNGIVLRGVRLDKSRAAPGDWLRLTLYWQAQSSIAEDLTVFTQLLDAGGQVRGQQDNPPRAGWYPTNLWPPGNLISDDYLLRIDPATPPGPLRLHVGLYRPDTLARLSTTAGADHAAIAEITVAN